MTNYNETGVDKGALKIFSSESQSLKQSFYGNKKEFEQYMMDGCKQSFSVVEGPEGKADSNPSSEEKSPRFPGRQAVEYSSSIVRQQLFSNYIADVGGGSKNQEYQPSSPSAREAVVKLELGVVKPEQTLPEDDPVTTPRRAADRSDLGLFAELNDKTDNNVRIFLSDGEYILKIVGDDRSLTSSDIHKYLEFLKRDYDFKISRAYFNNRLVFEQPGGGNENRADGDEYSDLNLYF